MPSKCPTCRKPVEEKGQFAPFCSERCKLIDLGRWLDGRYQVPVEEPDESDDQRRPVQRDDDD